MRTARACWMRLHAQMEWERVSRDQPACGSRAVCLQGALEPGEAAEVIVTFYIVGGPEGTASMLTQAQVSRHVQLNLQG